MATKDTPNDETPKLITVNADELQKMIADGVLNVMAQLKDPTSHAVADIDYDKLGEAIGDAVARGQAKLMRPKVTPGQYIRRAYSVYHTDGVGDFKRPKLTRVCFINGDFLGQVGEVSSRVNDDEVRLLNRITHSGRYIDRMVEVVVRAEGSDDAVEIRFSNKLENYMPLKAKCPDLKAMLEQIVAVQEVENEDNRLAEEDRKERRSRAHFNTAATREAKAKIG